LKKNFLRKATLYQKNNINFSPLLIFITLYFACFANNAWKIFQIFDETRYKQWDIYLISTKNSAYYSWYKTDARYEQHSPDKRMCTLISIDVLGRLKKNKFFIRHKLTMKSFSQRFLQGKDRRRITHWITVIDIMTRCLVFMKIMFFFWWKLLSSTFISMRCIFIVSHS